MDAKRVVQRPHRGPIRLMEVMIVVYGGGRLTDKMHRLFIRCFEIAPRVVVYRWMRYIKALDVGVDGSDVTIVCPTVFSDLRNLNAVVRADSFGLLWAVYPSLVIFPIDVQTPEGIKADGKTDGADRDDCAGGGGVPVLPGEPTGEN